ncbi:nuclear transport factor 2 family protein [Nocardiopsis sp. MG754419]|uniref:nuclear transport factor 2 family protein n=1 Tax=Nocardiopsis sp. MG754419 TaxID=2259865 RepID=UPI001BA80085|nr:nuclear transport factor 2 family protein [Nocardiopsis sp. MG754419]MBR8744004.1 nuclear transport factor 2 family protein [Nocardiopsis sp. MG754419]
MSAHVPEPVGGFFDRVNTQDHEALDLFAADAVVDDWGREFHGLDQIRAWSDREFIGSRGVLTVESVEETPDGVLVLGDWRSEHANGPSAFTFEVDGDAITRMTIREG